MAYYRGPAIVAGSVTLSAPTDEAQSACAAAELEPYQKLWLARAVHDDTILYFTVRAESRLIGQIMLHDIEPNEAMVGYHLFAMFDRGRGYGTDALAAISAYAFEIAHFDRLVAITSQQNAASRRIAEKCGFAELGDAREGGDLIVYELRRRARTETSE